MKSTLLKTGSLELTLAILKPHVVKATHALKVRTLIWIGLNLPTKFNYFLEVIMYVGSRLQLGPSRLSRLDIGLVYIIFH